MRNQDIIKAIYDNDTNGELMKCAKIYNIRVNKGNPSFKGIEKYQEIFILLINLSNDKYQVTKRDIELLKKYNVIINPRTNENKTEDKSFIAISDFHSYRYPLDKIKNYYLNEYDVIYILGDATDRGKDGYGTDGVKLLIDIMNLTKQYPGRVVYIPGNHDEFLLGYIRSKYNMDSYYQLDYTTNLIYNGGTSTINDINKLEKENPKLFNELISWLGKQPLQRNHKYDGKDYVLAHAIYNQKLFNLNPNYCLEDYFKEPDNSHTRRMAHDILWFRKFKNAYNPSEMPSADKIMIIGHTIEEKIRGKNIDLNDSMGRTIKVHCVDGGIAYKGGMLKYDGGETAMWTTILTHNNTSKSYPKTKLNISDENIFQNYILNKVLKEGKYGIHQIIFGSNPKELTASECKKIIHDNLDTIDIADEELNRSVYVKTFLVDYIIECQLERMKEHFKDSNKSISIAISSIDTFLSGTTDINYIRTYGNNGKDDYYNITSHKNAREIAKIIGRNIMEEVINEYGFQTIEEYINYKFIKPKKTQQNEIYNTNKGRR